MAMNRGLDSRFPVTLKFPTVSIADCVKLLFDSLGSKKLDVDGMRESQPLRKELEIYFEKLSALPSWGNARDVLNVTNEIFLATIRKPVVDGPLVVSENTIVNEIAKLLEERNRRETIVTSSCSFQLPSGERVDTESLANSVPLTCYDVSTQQTTAQGLKTKELPEEIPDHIDNSEDLAPNHCTTNVDDDADVGTKPAIGDSNESNDTNEGPQSEFENSTNEGKEAEKEEMKKQKIKDKLRSKCIGGYDWVKEGGGYRCFYGACFITHAELEDLES